MHKDTFTILIVEDDPSHRELIRRALGSSGERYQVFVSATLREYYETVKQSPPDLVLADINLPDGKALDILTADPDTQKWPVLIMTAFGDQELAVKALKAGALDYIVKSEQTFLDLPRIIGKTLREWRHIQQRRNVEKALQQSEERFRGIYENTTIGLYQTTPEGLILMANPALVRMLGYESVEELTQRNLNDRGYAPRYSRNEFIEQIEHKGIVIGLESAWLRKDGSTIFISESAKPIRNNEGRILYYEGTVEDISERRAAEISLRESEERFRHISTAMSDIAFSFVAGADGRFVIDWMMGAVEQITGYTIEEIKEKKCWGFMVDERDRRLFEEHVTIVHPGSSDKTELRLRKKNGELIWVSVNTQCQLDTQDFSAIRLYGGLEDITERKRSEEIQLRLNRQLRAISACHEILLRAADEHALLADICNVICDQAGYRMAWVGYAEHDEQKTVRPVAWAGFEEGYLFHARISWADTERGRGPTGTSIRNGEVIYIQDFVTDMRMALWRDNALRRSYRSSIAIPLRDEHNETFGALTIYSSEPNAFTPDEIRLLEELTDDTGFGISGLRVRNERRQAEEQRGIIEKDRDRFFEYSGDIIAITDLDGFVKQINPAWEKILGWRRDEIQNKRIRDLIHPEDDSALTLVLVNREKGERIDNFEGRYRCNDGSYRWISWNSYPLKSENIIFNIGRDISHRKESESAVRRSEERYRSLFEESMDGIYLATPEGEILDANPAGIALLGYSGKEDFARVRMPEIYWDPVERNAILSLLEQSGVVRNRELDLRTKDGKKITCTINIIAVRDEEGRIRLLRGFFRDITAQRQLERHFLQAQKLEGIGTVAGGIAHDFNNILGILLGHLEMLQRPQPNKEIIKQSFETMERAIERGTGLVKQILTFARQTEVMQGPVDVNVMIKEFVRMIAETFPKTIPVRYFPRAKSSTILADPTHIHQILLNISVNARDAMPNGGEIHINTQNIPGTSLHGQFPDAVPDEHFQLSIADTGIGMTDEVKNRIFDPFFTTKEKGKGTGLGLSTVYGIVKTHHGFITVESAKDKGTTFHVYFPLLKSGNMPAYSQLKTIQYASGHNETILLIEDEEPLANMVKIALKTNGYRVLVAYNGEQAIDIYSKKKDSIHLVLTDMDLPKLSGEKIFEKLLQLNPAVKLIFASGYVEPEVKARMFSRGAKGFLGKPYRANEILLEIRKFLDAEN